jgi:hypothetical protein
MPPLSGSAARVGERKRAPNRMRIENLAFTANRVFRGASQLSTFGAERGDPFGAWLVGFWVRGRLGLH